MSNPPKGFIRQGFTQPLVIIPSSFDDNLELRVTNEQARFNAEHPVYLWRICKWQGKLEKGSRRLFKYYSLKDLFLVRDLLDEGLAKLKFLYRPMFERSAKMIARGRMEEHLRLAPYIWAANLADSEEEEQGSEMPWEKKED